MTTMDTPLANPFDLTGKTAVVTGGGRGIGLGIARQLAASGARVMIAGRSEKTLQQALPEVGHGALAHPVDVSKEADVLALRDAAYAQLGHVDILVNNAGVNPYYKRTEKTSLEEWSLLINVNLTGTFLCIRHFVPEMLERGSGSIINVTSIAGASGLNRSAAYCATKGGVEAMTRSMAHDWAKTGVRVNCLAPGYVTTDLTDGLEDNQSLADRLYTRTPMGRFTTPGELGSSAVFLGADSSSYVTGTTLYVDGGWTAA